MEWLGERRLEPTLTDLYLARVALEVARVPFLVLQGFVGKVKAPDWTLRDFLLTPGEKDGTQDGPESRTEYTVDGKPYVVTKEQTAKWRRQLAQARWRLAAAVPPVPPGRRPPDREGWGDSRR